MRKPLVLIILLCCVGGVLCAGGCAGGRATVVWISIDGYRHDYADKPDAPLMKRIMREGAYSRQLEPLTPTLTFPSHVSAATGTPAGEHGIVSNDMYDAATRRQYNFPNDARLLEAEPIWITAKRQGVRTLVYDWPLSYRVPGGVECDYVHDKFDPRPSDAARLEALLTTWQNDRGKEPLRLLMGYVKLTDGVGHKHGPNSPQIREAIRETDALLAKFVDRSVELFGRTSRRGDQLYILLTTDHGMAPVHTLVNADKLFPTPLPKDVRIVTSGPLALIHLDQAPAAQRAGLMQTMLRDLRRHDFVATYTKRTLPKHWRMDHPTRVGEITLMLRPGYFFSRKYRETTYPAEADDAKGMHGYPLEDSPDMRGFCAVWRYPTSLKGRDVGKIGVEQLHPTVAKLLGVKSAPTARAKPVKIR